MTEPHGQHGHRDPPVAWRGTALAYPCDYCLAGPGETCRTSTNEPAFTPHASRSRLASADHWHNPDEKSPT